MFHVRREGSDIAHWFLCASSCFLSCLLRVSECGVSTIVSSIEMVFFSYSLLLLNHVMARFQHFRILLFALRE